jgi:endoribonuclease Dicer
MSAQILLDCLTHSYITMNEICLIVLDECHHATEEHPMNMVCKLSS